MPPQDQHVDLKDIFIPSERVVAREIEGELIIVPIDDGIANFEDTLFTFNATGRRLWDLLSPKTNVQEVCAQLSNEYNAPFEKIQSDVVELIVKLCKMGILQKKS